MGKEVGRVASALCDSLLMLAMDIKTVASITGCTGVAVLIVPLGRNSETLSELVGSVIGTLETYLPGLHPLIAGRDIDVKNVDSFKCGWKLLLRAEEGTLYVTYEKSEYIDHLLNCAGSNGFAS